MKSVTVESVHGDRQGQRMVFFRCERESGEVFSYGPVITADPEWDEEDYCGVLLRKLTEAQQ